jgi:hypothetical protein
LDGPRRSRDGADKRAAEPGADVAERLLGDGAELYLGLNCQLVRTVQKRVDASRDTVDDACAFAWVQFMRWQRDRDRNWRVSRPRSAAATPLGQREDLVPQIDSSRILKTRPGEAGGQFSRYPTAVPNRCPTP